MQLVYESEKRDIIHVKCNVNVDMLWPVSLKASLKKVIFSYFENNRGQSLVRVKDRTAKIYITEFTQKINVLMSSNQSGSELLLCSQTVFEAQTV